MRGCRSAATRQMLRWPARRDARSLISQTRSQNSELMERPSTSGGDKWAAEHKRLRATWAARSDRSANARPMDMSWVSRCLSEFIDDDTIVVNDYDLDPTQCAFRTPNSYFGPPPPAALGWGLGAAMGAKLAAPKKTVICTLGDGSYMFGEPTSAHFTAERTASLS